MALLKQIGNISYDFNNIVTDIVKVTPSSFGWSAVTIAFAHVALREFLVECQVTRFMQLVANKDNKAIADLNWKEAIHEPLLTEPKFTRAELLTLADIAWFFKGYVAAKVEDDPNDFGQMHVDVLVKAINELKKL